MRIPLLLKTNDDLIAAGHIVAAHRRTNDAGLVVYVGIETDNGKFSEYTGAEAQALWAWLEAHAEDLLPEATQDKPTDAPRAAGARMTPDTLIVELVGGGEIHVPCDAFPRLRSGTPEQRAHFEMSGRGLHWPDLDEDLSVEGLARRFGVREEQSP